MTDLSPTAQAVLDGFRAVPSLMDGPSIAGALRAAADQVEQKLRGFSHEACQEIRAIATELENANV